MKTRLARITLVVATLSLALAWPAAAVTVDYTVGGTGPMPFPAAVTPPAGSPHGPTGYPGDTVELLSYSGTLDLIPGTSVLKINTLQWTIDYTYGGTDTCWDWPACWSELFFPVDAARSITVHTSSGTLAQTGLLECNWDDDHLSFAGGSTVTFSMSGVLVHVTPLPLARIGAFSKATKSGSQPPDEILCDLPCALAPRDLWAEFVVEGSVPVAPETWFRVKALYR
jgi:hypothetical protein